MSIAAMKQALKVLKGCLEHPDAEDAITALRTAIEAAEKQEPEPACWQGEDGCPNRQACCDAEHCLYTAPPAAQRQPLHTSMAATVQDAARDAAKCLNERDGVGLDLRHVAMLAHHAQRQPLTLPGLAKVAASVPSLPFEGDWHLEFARAIEQAHGITGESK